MRSRLGRGRFWRGSATLTGAILLSVLGGAFLASQHLDRLRLLENEGMRETGRLWGAACVATHRAVQSRPGSFAAPRTVSPAQLKGWSLLPDGLNDADGRSGLTAQYGSVLAGGVPLAACSLAGPDVALNFPELREGAVMAGLDPVGFVGGDDTPMHDRLGDVQAVFGTLPAGSMFMTGDYGLGHAGERVHRRAVGGRPELAAMEQGLRFEPANPGDPRPGILGAGTVAGERAAADRGSAAAAGRVAADGDAVVGALGRFTVQAGTRIEAVGEFAFGGGSQTAFSVPGELAIGRSLPLAGGPGRGHARLPARRHGRVRAADNRRGGRLLAIVEHRDADEETRKIGFCNAGIMAADGRHLLSLLDAVGNDNAKGEYSLTDLVEIARSRGLGCAVTEAADPDEVMGVNARSELAVAEAVFQRRARARAMAGGATLIDPDSIYFSHDTRLGRDVVIGPQVVFGPGVTIGDRVTVKAFCHIEGAEIAEGAAIGPFARLRPGARIGDRVRVGNFVEIKASSLEAGVRVNHLSYVGDSRVGEGANIGAGTITCNYDGFAKAETEIGAGAFIGSNSALVAPVTIGAGAIVGAGSVIATDVPADSLAVGRGRQEGQDRLGRGVPEAPAASRAGPGTVGPGRCAASSASSARARSRRF